MSWLSQVSHDRMNPERHGQYIKKSAARWMQPLCLSRQTFEPLVCRGDHGIALVPVKLDHPAREKEGRRHSLPAERPPDFTGGAGVMNWSNCTHTILVTHSRYRCAATAWEAALPVDVSEEAVLAPAVQQLRDHELQGGTSQRTSLSSAWNHHHSLANKLIIYAELPQGLHWHYLVLL